MKIMEFIGICESLTAGIIIWVVLLVSNKIINKDNILNIKTYPF